MFGKGKRERGGKSKTVQVVAICDHLVLFLKGEPEREIFGKTVAVSLDLFIESLS